MKQLTSTFFTIIFILLVSSCSSLSPYKVPVLQGNIFEEEDLENLKLHHPDVPPLSRSKIKKWCKRIILHTKENKLHKHMYETKKK